MEKLKGLWISDLGVPTGFARVSHSIIENIKDRVDITGFGVNYQGNPHQLGIDIYPATGGPEDPMGFSKIADTVNRAKYDFIYMLQDVWVINRYLAEIKSKVDVDKIPKIIIYFPVDAEEHDKEWYSNFDIVTKIVTYTEYAKGVVLEASPELDIDVIPHGVDSDKFYTSFRSRDEAKQEVFAKQKSYADFIVLNSNRNQPRKRLDLTLRGFKIFAEGKDDVAIYMHCGVIDSSIDVVKLAVRLGIDNKLVMTNLIRGPQSVSDEDLNLILNACDVGINTSLGEGWGLCAIEHAATGAPQIVPDSSACKELFGDDIGILIPTVADYTFDGVMTVGKLVSPEGVAEALEIAYKAHKEGRDIGKDGKVKFLSDKYDWKVIAEQWYSAIVEATK